jgi:hypothetical protein
MVETATELGALGEAVVFLNYFRDLPDPRQAGKVLYPLAEVVLLRPLAVLAGAETFVDITRFGQKKLDLLRRFRPFRDGTPSHLSPRRHLCDARRRKIPALLRRLGRGTDGGVGRCDRHSMARRCDAPTRRKARKLRSTWSRPLRRASASCLGRLKWRRRVAERNCTPPPSQNRA